MLGIIIESRLSQQNKGELINGQLNNQEKILLQFLNGAQIVLSQEQNCCLRQQKSLMLMLRTCFGQQKRIANSHCFIISCLIHWCLKGYPVEYPSTKRYTKYAYSTQKAMSEYLLIHPVRKNPDSDFRYLHVLGDGIPIELSFLVGGSPIIFFLLR